MKNKVELCIYKNKSYEKWKHALISLDLKLIQHFNIKFPKLFFFEKKKPIQDQEAFNSLIYEMKWILGIYNFFFVKLAIGWSNNCCKLILTVGLKFEKFGH